MDGNPPVARVHISGGHWLGVRAARMDEAPAAVRGTIAVTIEPASPVAVTSNWKLADVAGAVKPSVLVFAPVTATAGPWVRVHV